MIELLRMVSFFFEFAEAGRVSTAYNAKMNCIWCLEMLMDRQYKVMSNNNTIGEPDKFQLATVVTKNSRTGITSNRRLLVIKGGKLYYYSNIPKVFNGDLKALEMNHWLPKCSIDIVNIKNINEFDLNSAFFSIEFEGKHLMEKEDIRNSAMNADYNFTPRDTSDEITWQFTCDNQFVKKRWVSALKSLKEYYKEEDVRIQKFMQTIDNHPPPLEDVKSSSYSSRSSIKLPMPWRQSTFSRRSYNPDKTFEFKESPRQNGKIEEITFLKKGRSDHSLKREEYLKPDDTEFQMIVHEEPHRPSSQLQKKPTKIEDVFDHRVAKPALPALQSKLTKSEPQQISSYNVRLPTPMIEEVAEDISLSQSQTPFKERTISYSDSEGVPELGKSFDKMLEGRSPEMSPIDFHRQYQKPKMLQFHHSFSIEVPGLPVVTEELNNSKESLEMLNNSKDSIEPVVTHLASSESALRKSIEISIKEADRASSSSLISEASQVQRRFTEEDRSYRFQWFWGESCRTTCKFQARLEQQKLLINEMTHFREKAGESLSNWLESRARGEDRYPVIQETTHYLVVEVGNIVLKVALLSTQKLTINGLQKIHYNEDSIKNLKREFKVHQNLFRSISKQLRTNENLLCRVPLSVYLEFKGVCCIATNQYPQEKGLSGGLEGWSEEEGFLLASGYRSEWFNFRTVGSFLLLSVKTRGKVFSNDEESLKQFLKKVVLVGRGEKNHNLVFDPPISRLFLEQAFKQNASTSIQSLERYVKGLRAAKSFQGPCPKEEIIEVLSYCIFCKQLRKVYRAAQGQISETHFFNLVFKQDPGMMTLLRQSDCQLPQPLRPHIFSFLQHYFGVILEINDKVFKQWSGSGEHIAKKDMFLSSSVSALVREYSLQGMELMESFSKLGQYIEERHPLAGAALQKKKEVYRLSENLPVSKCLQLLYEQANHLYHECDFTGCIKKCQEYENICPPQATHLFALYLLMMKSYSHFSEHDFSSTFHKATQLIETNYGNNSCLISLYSLAAFYYQQLGHQQPELLPLSRQLIQEARQRCLACFGPHSKQYFDIVMDTSRLYSRQDMGAALGELDEAKKICQQNAHLFTSNNLVTLLSFQAELALKRGALSQAETCLSNIGSLLDVKIPVKSRAHFYKLQYEVGIYGQKREICQQALDHLWELGSSYKLEALEMGYQLALKETKVSQAENLLLGEEGQWWEGAQKAVMWLQGERQQEGSLLSLLLGAMERGDSKVIGLVYRLIHPS